MHSSNLNKGSLRNTKTKNFMQEGGQPQMQASPNDPMEQLVPAIKAAIEQGMPLPQVILTLSKSQVPMEVIEQGLVIAGISEQEIMSALNQLQQQQAQSQEAVAVEGPIQPTEPTPAEAQPKMPAVDQTIKGQPMQVPMAEDGMEFLKVGKSDRYKSLIDKAQYGMGIYNPINFNQFNRQDNVRPNINSAYLPMNLGMKGSNVNLLATIGEGLGRLFGAKDKDGDGVADGAFRDLKAKRNRHKDTIKLMKGKVPEGMQNFGDKLMMKYDPETGNYDTGYNDPRYQSNIRKKNYANLFKKGKKFRTDEFLNRPNYEEEGFKSFNQLKSDMSKLSQEDKDKLRYVADERTNFQNEKMRGRLPEGMQFGMDARGGVGYYDKDATLPDNSQENINKMMMQNFMKGGSFDNPGFKALPESVQQKIMGGIKKGQDGKEIVQDIMQRPEMKHVQEQEELARYYMDIIRQMQQQHALEMQRLMMQMQEPSIEESQMMQQQQFSDIPPMQMGGGYSLPFAQVGGTPFQNLMQKYPDMPASDTLYTKDPRMDFVFAPTAYSQDLNKAFDDTYGDIEGYEIEDGDYTDAEARILAKQKQYGGRMNQSASLKNPQDQAQMMQQMMSSEQLMQMQQYLEQLLQEIQAASQSGRPYKKPSPHDMNSVELTTEQIAKIMAAGGSVKIL